MSFIEGHLSLSHAGSAWTKRWCKVDKNEFSWAAGEAAPPLGRLPLAAGGTVVPTADAHGLFRFNLYADGRTLECSALSEAELDGWLDFLVAETAVQKADKPPAPKAAPKPALKAKAAPKVPAAPAQKVTQKAVVAALIKEAIEMEEFEKCVKYRKFRSVRCRRRAAAAAPRTNTRFCRSVASLVSPFRASGNLPSPSTCFFFFVVFFFFFFLIF